MVLKTPELDAQMAELNLLVRHAEDAFPEEPVRASALAGKMKSARNKCAATLDDVDLDWDAEGNTDPRFVLPRQLHNRAAEMLPKLQEASSALYKRAPEESPIKPQYALRVIPDVSLGTARETFDAICRLFSSFSLVAEDLGRGREYDDAAKLVGYLLKLDESTLASLLGDHSLDLFATEAEHHNAVRAPGKLERFVFELRSDALALSQNRDDVHRWQSFVQRLKNFNNVVRMLRV